MHNKSLAMFLLIIIIILETMNRLQKCKKKKSSEVFVPG